MLKKERYPILEFDDCTDAVINPSVLKERFGHIGSDMLIITFFKEAMHKLIEEGRITHHFTICGENELKIYRFTDENILIMHGTIGCPACAGFMDGMIGMGIKKIIFCGGGGVLDKSIAVGKLIICNGAIRDEGFSYHYVKPSRIIYTDPKINGIISDYLINIGAEFINGISWTTDAVYRETRGKVNMRRDEGAVIVEMEQSGCIAVAQARGVKYGAILYAGDDVSGDAWDDRSWHSRKGLRYDLIMHCKKIVTLI